jgi:hypothetical protein
MNNQGSLAYALLLVLVLTALSAAILLKSVNENSIASRVASSSAALWAAEAGVQRAFWEYRYNNCIGMVQEGTATACSSCSSCGGGNKTLAATLSGYGDYDVILNDASSQIRSVGSIPSRSSAKKVVRNIQTALSKPSIFSYGIFAKGQVTIANNALVDSYNSLNGLYGGANILHHGNVGSNGTTAGIVNVNNNGTVYGNVSTGAGGTVTQGAGSVVSGTITNDNSIELPSVVVPTTLTGLASGGTYSASNNQTKTLNAGDYRYTNVSLSNNSILNINGTVRLYLTGANALTTGNNVIINVNSGANLTVYSNGVVTFNNNVTINNVAKDASKFLIYSTYSSSTYGVTLNNNSASYVGVYAPNTKIDISNNAGLFGAVVGKEVNLNNNGQVHYDEALASMANPYENVIVNNWQEY